MPVDISRPKRQRKFRIDEISDIISIYKRMTVTEGRGVGESCKLIGEQYGRSQETIYALICRFRPSVDGAEAYLKANALKLAMRVVRKSNVDQAISILERSNMGVLAPKQDGGGGNAGFFLSVQTDALGAVRVTAGQASLPPQTLVLPEGSGVDHPSGRYSRPSGYSTDAEERSDDERSEEELRERVPTMIEAGVPHENQGTFLRTPSPDQQKAIEQARARLKEAQRIARLAKNRGVGV